MKSSKLFFIALLILSFLISLSILGVKVSQTKQHLDILRVGFASQKKKVNEFDPTRIHFADEYLTWSSCIF